MAEIQRIRDDVLELDRQIRRLRAEQQQRGAGDFVRANAIVGVLPSDNVPAHGSMGLWTNQSGGALGIGAVVVQNGDRQFDTTATADDLDVVGVLTEAIANTEEGRLRHQGYHPDVIVEGAVVAGQFLRTSTTAGAAEDAGTIPTEGVFAIALTATAGPGAGTVAAYLFGTIGALTADSVYLPRVSGSTYDDVEDMQTTLNSAGWISGGAVTVNGGDPSKVDIAAGTGLFRSGATSTSQLLFADWPQRLAQATAAGNNYVGVEWNGGTPQAVVRAVENWNHFTDWELAIAVNEGGTLHIQEHAHVVGDAIHLVNERWHQTEHIERDNETGGNILGESGDNARNVLVTAGAYWVGLTRIATGAFNSAGADNFDTYSAGGLEAAGVSVWPNLQYDNGGVLANLGGNKWANLWWYQELDGDIVMIYGTAQYNTEAMAGEEAAPTTVPTRIVVHGKLIGRYIFQRGDTIPTQVAGAFVNGFAVAGVTVHSGLSGIGGGEDDHPEYLLADGSRNLTGDLLAAVATEINFRDTDLKIYSSADGQLDIDADVEVEINAPTVDIPGASVVIGVNDTTRGELSLYGHGAGQARGGTLMLFMSADHDAAFESWRVEAYQDDLLFRGSTEKGRLTFEGQFQLPITGSAGGYRAGGDALWYRSAADTWRTPDAVIIEGLLSVDVIGELTGAVGVTVENVTIRDGSIELHHGTDTIAGDEILTPTGGYIIAAAQAGVADDLDGIGGGANGRLIVVRADGGDTITVRHNNAGGGAGRKILLNNNSDLALVGNDEDSLTLLYDESLDSGNGAWFEITRSGSATCDLSAYAIANVTPDRTYDADATSIDELADVLGTLIDDLDGCIGGGGSPDASTVTYTPAVLADWDGDADPGNVNDALDELAERTTDVEERGVYEAQSSATLVFGEGSIWYEATPFSGTINGAPAATTIVYNVTALENSIMPGQVIHNTTRGERAYIEAVNYGTNTLTVEADSPHDVSGWANTDVITTASQTNLGRGGIYTDIDVTPVIAGSSAVTGVALFINWVRRNADDHFVLTHPCEAFDANKETTITRLQNDETHYAHWLQSVTAVGGRYYFTMCTLNLAADNGAGNCRIMGQFTSLVA